MYNIHIFLSVSIVLLVLTAKTLPFVLPYKMTIPKIIGISYHETHFCIQNINYINTTILTKILDIESIMCSS